MAKCYDCHTEYNTAAAEEHGHSAVCCDCADRRASTPKTKIRPWYREIEIESEVKPEWGEVAP